MAMPPGSDMEERPFVTSKYLAPANNLSHESGNSFRSQYDTDDCEGGEDEREGSECPEGSADSEYAVDEIVREDMAKLEETFREIGMKYRMIARIGEGNARILLTLAYLSNHY